MQDADGAPPYEALRRRAIVVDLHGTPVAIIGLSDLIVLKRAADRPVDRDHGIDC
jgi:predicted nucleotidyltransferase